MIETSKHIPTVTLERQHDVQASREQVAQQALQSAEANGQERPLDTSTLLPFAPPEQVPQPEASVQTETVQPIETSTPDPEASFRQTRIIITAGLVVLLIVVWFIQKRNSLQ